MIRLLTIKHWHFFIAIICIPILFQFVLVGLTIINSNPISVFAVFPIIILFVCSLFFSWLYALGTNLYKKFPEKTVINLKQFNFFLISSIVYIFILSVFIICIFSNDLKNIDINSITLIIPLHLFFVISTLSCLYIVAKNLKMVELQRSVTLSDFVGSFLLLCFWPIGIWIIQPRVNKLFR
jgi:hypothetical protein